MTELRRGMLPHIVAVAFSIRRGFNVECVGTYRCCGQIHWESSNYGFVRIDAY